MLAAFLGCFAGHHRQGREEEKKLSPAHPFSSVSRGGAWVQPTRRHCSSNVHTGPEGFSALLWIFGVCFVIFKVFNGIFV
jgi:hypothetical protein